MNITQKLKNRFWSKVNKNGEYSKRLKSRCWEWTAYTCSFGYGYMGVGPRTHSAHRISWMIHTGKMPKLCVLHKCDNPACVRPDHLFLGTRADNAHDMFAKGRSYDRRGEGNPRSKLTEKDVIEIRELYDTGKFTQRQIGKMFGVSDVSISYIIIGKTWKNV